MQALETLASTWFRDKANATDVVFKSEVDESDRAAPVLENLCEGRVQLSPPPVVELTSLVEFAEQLSRLEL